MHWAVSDVHGCYEQYRKLLEKIHFSPSDTLYFLGDAVDRGPEPMKVVLDLCLATMTGWPGRCCAGLERPSPRAACQKVLRKK